MFIGLIVIDWGETTLQLSKINFTGQSSRKYSEGGSFDRPAGYRVDYAGPDRQPAEQNVADK